VQPTEPTDAHSTLRLPQVRNSEAAAQAAPVAGSQATPPDWKLAASQPAPQLPVQPEQDSNQPANHRSAALRFGLVEARRAAQ
jgi:hypothetical protein